MKDKLIGFMLLPLFAGAAMAAEPQTVVSIENGSTPKSVDFNERRRIGQGPSIDNFQSFYSRRLGVVLASSCGGSPR